MIRRVVVFALLGALGLGASAAEPAAPAEPEEQAVRRCFSDDFLFGAATAAYQVEGAWNESRRTPSIWDAFCREKAPKLECADVADDFFHRYRQDVQLMVATGLQTFRFSISWSRLMTWSAVTRRMVPNPEGIAFYHALMDELLVNHITPLATLYHWDLPLELHTELSPPGWLNKEIVGHFAEYAELAFREFGGKVSVWSTFNEPWTFAVAGYGTGVHAPGLKHSATNTYTVGHHVLLAHGAVVRRFRELRESGTALVQPTSRIGIVLNADFGYPLNASDPEDVAAAHRKMHFGLGWFLQPLVSGDYPDIMRERAGDRLPEFTSDEAELVRGSYDLFMLNHYSSKLVTDCRSPESHVRCHKQARGWERDLGVDESRMPPGARPSSKDRDGNYNCKWFTGYPRGYLDTIRWMHLHDPSAQILLTENGWCGNDEIDNLDQLWYFQSYIEQVYKAVYEENIPIIGYTAWSFLDNYEWGSFTPRFGLYYVDYPTADEADAARPSDLSRIPRPAAIWYSQVAKSKCLDQSPRADAPELRDELRAELPVGRWALRSAVAATAAMLVAVAALLARSGRLRALGLHRPRRLLLLDRRETTPLLAARRDGSDDAPPRTS